MPKHQIMDHSGHDTKAWDKADTVGVAKAEQRFNALRAEGYYAQEPGVNGEPGRLLKAFDPNVETTIFSPQLQGG